MAGTRSGISTCAVFWGDLLLGEDMDRFLGEGFLGVFLGLWKGALIRGIVRNGGGGAVSP